MPVRTELLNVMQDNFRQTQKKEASIWRQ